jgi:hypothetical protein
VSSNRSSRDLEEVPHTAPARDQAGELIIEPPAVALRVTGGSFALDGCANLRVLDDVTEVSPSTCSPQGR